MVSSTANAVHRHLVKEPPTTSPHSYMILVVRQSHHGSMEFALVMAESTGILPGSSPVADKPVLAAFGGDRLTSEAGALLLVEIDRRLSVLQASGALHQGPALPSASSTRWWR